MRLAGGTNKALFHDLFAHSEGEEDDEDFYKSEGDSESGLELGGSIPGSVPGMPTKTGQVPMPQNDPLQVS